MTPELEKLLQEFVIDSEKTRNDREEKLKKERLDELRGFLLGPEQECEHACMRFGCSEKCWKTPKKESVLCRNHTIAVLNGGG